MTPRRGPRPLPLHLGLAGLRGWAALASLPPSSAAWPSWSAGWPISRAGRAEAQRLLARLDASGSSAAELREAVSRRLGADNAALIAGIAAYRRHPEGPPPPPAPPTLWAEGTTRLLDHASGATGPAILFVPSLVNRARVLDLLPGHSLLRWFAAQGTHPLLLDWDSPGEAERGMDLTGFIAGRLERALAAAQAATGGPVILAGYCMGGLLTLAAAIRRPELVRGLALLATPWDFWADGAEARSRALAALLPALEPALAATGTLPVEALQALFSGLDPFGVSRKFRGFPRLDPASPRTTLFVALEDWLNDGIPLPAPVARETLAGWYGENTPARLRWRVAGRVVDPADWPGPSFLAIPHRDRIVPPDSARALAARLPRAVLHDAPAGHIGMAAGSTAETALWQPLLAWATAVSRESPQG
ncbi:alpha/beta fold hydrolase [Roseomonas sp. BN140053]|uniref:alpha/beta fold hydrolase n=1 Tax=Roseomonas sp. BN140053 TaxID=3391898 RepID=UPI0039E8A448